MTDATGIVFVLLPGGTFNMGAQRDADGPNHDPDAIDNESPVHEVVLAPFFLARHELTQGQWERLRSLDAPQRPSRYGAGSRVGNEDYTLAHPVEQVDWVTSHALLTRHGLLLPTEAQWEYGCRGGGATPWSCPFDELAVSTNLADAAAKRGIPTWTCEAWDDAHIAHAGVGSFAANGFGLHDVHGNVWEWCLDELGSYAGPVREGDGFRLQPDTSARRVYRGGSFNVPAVRARSAYRVPGEPTHRNSVLGLRAARALRPHR